MTPRRLARRHLRVLQGLFEQPVRTDLRWDAVESLFAALGAEINEGRGSRVRVVLSQSRAVFHRPHPGNELHRGAVRAVRRFLVAAGCEPGGFE